MTGVFLELGGCCGGEGIRGNDPRETRKFIIKNEDIKNVSMKPTNNREMFGKVSLKEISRSIFQIFSFLCTDHV